MHKGLYHGQILLSEQCFAYGACIHRWCVYEKLHLLRAQCVWRCRDFRAGLVGLELVELPRTEGNGGSLLTCVSPCMIFMKLFSMGAWSWPGCSAVSITSTPLFL